MSIWSTTHGLKYADQFGIGRCRTENEFVAQTFITGVPVFRVFRDVFCEAISDLSTNKCQSREIIENCFPLSFTCSPVGNWPQVEREKRRRSMEIIEDEKKKMDRRRTENVDIVEFKRGIIVENWREVERSVLENLVYYHSISYQECEWPELLSLHHSVLLLWKSGSFTGGN